MTADKSSRPQVLLPCVILKSVIQNCITKPQKVNTLRLKQNCRHFADDIFKSIFLNECIGILLKISLKFVPEVWINNIPALVQIMAWRRSGDKALSEPMMVCITWPHWINRKKTCFNRKACSIYISAKQTVFSKCLFITHFNLNPSALVLPI